MMLFQRSRKKGEKGVVVKLCESGVLFCLVEDYLLECKEQTGKGKGHGRFPNLAGLCRFLGTGVSDIEELRKERPDEHERLMAILEDEALCADVSPTLLASYMKRRLGYGDAECGATGQREVVWRFEHDIYKDGE